MAKILLIEDNRDLSLEIKKYIEGRGYEIFLAEGLEEAKGMVESDFDLALLDINLPDGDGITLLELLRDKGVLVIITTVKNDEKFIVKALDRGASDYMVKPFGLDYLRARIDLNLRERARLSDGLTRYKSFLLNDLEKTIYLNDLPLSLTATEFEILSVFLKNPHRVLTRDFLLESFWDSKGAFVNDNTLTVTIKRIREKVGGGFISTIRGIGYRLD